MHDSIYYYFKEAKKVMANDEIQKELHEEFEEFCGKLLVLIEGAKNSENEMNKQFVSKMIEYIGHAGKSTGVNTHIVKYLLTALTHIIDMAGKKGETKKEKRKSQKQLIVTQKI